MFADNFKGCLFSNTMREKDCVNEKTYNIPKDYFSKITIEIEKSLFVAKDKGEFNGDSRAMSLIIITFIHGFNVFGKYNHSKEDGELIIKNLLNMII